MNRTLSVIGLGYIGLPLALCLCEKGFKVIGVDTDAAKIATLQCGYTDVHEQYHGESLELLLGRHLATGQFRPTTRIAEAAWEADTYLVTVGIPVSPHGALNDGPILSVAEQLGRVIKPNDLIIWRSTVVPGMLERRLIPSVDGHSGLRAGKDYHVAYAAERVAEGRAMVEFETLDIVLAGLTDRCAERATEVFQQLTSGTIHCTDLRTAQLSKVIENAQRDVNIALAQELAVIADFHNVDVYELIRMANTHPRVQLLEPGIGVGGFCIPNAYRYLTASMRQSESQLPMFHLARAINDHRPDDVIMQLDRQLHVHGKSLATSKVALLGLGMKDFSNDIRLSPAVDCAERMTRLGATVVAYDPTVPLQLPYQVDSLSDCLQGADAVFIGVWQHAFEDPGLIAHIEYSTTISAVLDLRGRLGRHRFTEFDPVSNANHANSAPSMVR